MRQMAGNVKIEMRLDRTADISMESDSRKTYISFFFVKENILIGITRENK